jgi:riboflavin kinase/FMN adenylyltransferase
MKYYDSIEQYNAEPCAVMIGKFDGLHLGHRALISAMKEQSEELSKVIMSFVMNGSGTKEILNEREKITLCEELGLDAYLHVEFDDKIRNMTPESFVSECLHKKLNAKAVYVGSNFRFGKNRAGDPDMLKKLCREFGIKVVVIPGITIHGIPVSATEIRKRIFMGDMKEAAELLGTPYFVSGTVIKGRQLGRTMKFPTLNLMPEKEKILPPNGVYMTETVINGRKYPSVTNVGTKPSVTDEMTVFAETHLLHFPKEEEPGYGSEIRVEFLDFIRPERKFGSVEELYMQIEQDVRQVRAGFENKSV